MRFALQPLALIDDAAERAWAAEWTANILSRETIVVTPEAKDHLWSALSSLASAPVAERTLTGLPRPRGLAGFEDTRSL